MWRIVCGLTRFRATEGSSVATCAAAAPVVVGHRHEAPLAMVLEAALCIAGKLHGVEERFSDQILQAAHDRFRGRIGLQELLMEAAWANGYTGRSFRSDMRSVLMAAFSTFTLPGILSNTANKFLLQAVNAVESNWRAIAAIRSVSDFKQVTSYRLIADLMYEEIGADGELHHDKVGEEGCPANDRVHRRGSVFLSGNKRRWPIAPKLATKKRRGGRSGHLGLKGCGYRIRPFPGP